MGTGLIFSFGLERSLVLGLQEPVNCNLPAPTFLEHRRQLLVSFSHVRISWFQFFLFFSVISIQFNSIQFFSILSHLGMFLSAFIWLQFLILCLFRGSFTSFLQTLAQISFFDLFLIVISYSYT